MECLKSVMSPDTFTTVNIRNYVYIDLVMEYWPIMGTGGCHNHSAICVLQLLSSHSTLPTKAAMNTNFLYILQNKY